MSPFRLIPLRPLALAVALFAPSLAHADANSDALRAALSLADAGDWASATAKVNGSIARDIIEWQRLRSGEGLMGDYEAFLQRRPDWPGLALLSRKGETAVARSTDPDRVIAWFDGGQPATVEGSFALIRAYATKDMAQQAQAEAVRAWIALSFTAEQENQLLKAYPKALAAVNSIRLDRLLWDGDADEARRMLPRVGGDWRALGEARLALRADAPGVDSKLKVVPTKMVNDPGLLYERFIWRMRKDRYEDAGDLIIQASTSAESLGRPEEWAERRALLARRLLRDGDPRTAYRVASSHHLAGGADYADLEFIAGFISLRYLGDANAALDHFRALSAVVATPISVARGAYWQGRALEALGRTNEAAEAYAKAARHQTAYYGLLAAERAGIPLNDAILGTERYPDWRKQAFSKSSVLQAALLLQHAGDRVEAKRFLIQLAGTLDAQSLGSLGQMALDLDEPHFAVLIGKQAAEQGVVLPRVAFPVTDLVPDGLAVSRALALSIARRESEFDPGVVSSAGAEGLMQVMPATAKMMAQKTGRAYERSKLRDPAYNAALGSAYLKQLAEEFGPSIALIASGYNAGPGRPRAWVQQLGDPRREDVDVVDWVEMIPFAETRTYVMRVAESVVIYRARLKGAVGPVQITGELKG
ncbi:MAG: lytic transglycosylase [Cereibacter sphaeroides]|uniref:Lytic transglycosylase n=1 Tax=Cereibacter sphaeroides TaxID=1063 RepID=A0A2W5UIZ8_CERSP|nr:MAG: lytic transglycosylase [Cereibacter sphaeroides]